MDYRRIYVELIRRSLPRGLNRDSLIGYHEQHHIVPRCLGGTDDPENLVSLTGREHYLAHMLLWKIYPASDRLVLAAWAMNMSRDGQRINSRLYQSLREAVQASARERGHKLTGESNPFYGKTHTEASKELMRQRRLGKMPSNAGSPKSEQIRAKISATKRSKSYLPWEHRSIIYDTDNLAIWRSADSLHAFWIALAKPKFVKFSVEYNRRFGTELISTKFKALIIRFSGGWIPTEDHEWVQFKG
jgi:hypothetical protein